MGVALVTGGSRGLGAALCEEYRARGWSVMEFSRTAPHAYSVRVDLADLAAAADAFEAAFGSIAARECGEVVVVNNAAVLGPVGPVALSPAEAVASAIDVNVTAGILCAAAFVRAFQLQACEKSFVNVSSGAAIHGHPGWSVYSATKAAMEQFVVTLALEQERQAHPVRAFSVNPGVMDTAMQAEVRTASEDAFPEVEHYRRLQAEGRLASARVVAGRIADLVASRPEPGATYSASR